MVKRSQSQSYYRADTEPIQSEYRLNREQSRASIAATEQRSYRTEQPQSKEATEQIRYTYRPEENRAASEQIQGRASHTEIQSLRATGQPSQRQRVTGR